MRMGHARACLVLLLTAALVGAGVQAAGSSYADSPALPHTTLAFTSDPGGVGQGIHRTFDSVDDQMTALSLTSSSVVVQVLDPTEGNLPWTLTIDAATGQTLAVQSYGGLDDLDVPGAASLDLTGDGRSCSDNGGGSAFTIKDLEVSGTDVTRLDVTFEHHCGVPADFGELRIGEPDDPSVSFPWQTIAFPATPLSTSASTAYIPVDSTSDQTVPFSYGLAQATTHPFAVLPGSCGAFLSAHGQCELEVTFTAGDTGTTQGTLTISVGATSTPLTLIGTTGFGRTLMSFVSNPGDPIGKGSGGYVFAQPNSSIQVTSSPVGFSGTVDGAGGHFTFSFQSADGDLEPGNYAASDTSPHRVSFGFSGFGRTCTNGMTPTSSVVIRQIQLSSIVHRVIRFDASFAQTCTGATGAFSGRIQFNATPSLETVVAPVRVLDTRINLGTSGGAIPPYGSVTFSLADQSALDVPGVTSVVLNLAAVLPTRSGYIAAETGGSAPGSSSALNFNAGQTVANLTSVLVGPSKSVTLRNGSLAPLNVIADLQAVSVAAISDAAGAEVPLPASRVLQSSGGKLVPRATVPGGGTTVIDLSSYVAGPATGIGAALANLTVVNATRGGYLTVWADGQAKPGTSATNFAAGPPSSNLAVVPVGTDGKVKVFNGSLRPVDPHLRPRRLLRRRIAEHDVGSSAVTSSTRLLDTRIGVGAPKGAVGPGQSVVLNLVGGPPQAAVLTITVTQPVMGGYLSLNLGTTASPAGTSVINFMPGQTRANLTVTRLGSGLTITNHSLRTAQIIVDKVGIVS